MVAIDNNLKIPLTSADHQWVKTIALQSGCQGEKLQRLIKNLLAVRAIAHWLEIYGIDYDEGESYSRQPPIHLGETVADLYLPNLGRLECRGIGHQEEEIYFGAESWQDRLGYAVVEISEDLRQGEIFGFLESFTAEIVPKQQLQPIEGLFRVIATAEQASMVLAPVEVVQNAVNRVTDVIQTWVERVTTTTWQLGTEQWVPQLIPVRSLGTVERIIDKFQGAKDEATKQRLIITLGELATENDQPQAIAKLVEIIDGTNNEDTRWLAAGTLARIDAKHPQAVHSVTKTIAHDLALGQIPLTLTVSLMPRGDHTIAGLITLQPLQSTQTLPAGLALALLTTDDQLIDSIGVGEEEQGGKNLLKMSLEIDPGSDFRIRVSLGELAVTEDIHL
ncbi:sll0281 [Synechocystis sp. PCC 6803]|uniref:Sll0281 protein n=1 Tax=Synechocystis sp. (strain ATCC 27184 / PCC 6803 / Kazusa) TaxID=1111708 RepID=Q55916_SYNY3|nr:MULTISPECIES: DUF1822 family protein [unclassified Synechocystis]BAM53724.1 hypothetical protein BEST7613_4793 [Synechocystis sp. PCC 6803] [Bacillus subtilis BEST7613]AGF52970.1 hypothetical protein MYO_127420 [Synechocystis sp. PCC 6803]ALJ68863.1 hypothetical protein AOY38_14085 [Synechocystis sp. PCC 6803]AVP90726.1 DUF1822 domain-containing protein [Synechocystis sp. IPPAS B-1465]MBD2618815.1 DUF1822 family protein [Synechocystis sp. FACHB-898]